MEHQVPCCCPLCPPRGHALPSVPRVVVTPAQVLGYGRRLLDSTGVSSMEPIEEKPSCSGAATHRGVQGYGTPGQPGPQTGETGNGEDSQHRD